MIDFLTRLRGHVVDMLFSFYEKKPDTAFLIVILLGFVILFCLFKILSMLKFKKKPDVKYPKQTDVLSLKSFDKEDRTNFYESPISVFVEAMRILKIRRKLEKGEPFRANFAQAISIFQNPRFLFYVSEFEKFLFEKIADERLSGNIEKGFMKKQTINKNQIIEIGDGAKVTIDKNGLIREFKSSESVSKEMSLKIDEDFKSGNIESFLNESEAEGALKKRHSKEEREQKEIADVVNMFFQGDSKKNEKEESNQNEPISVAEYKKNLRTRNKKQTISVENLKKMTDEVFDSEKSEALREDISREMPKNEENGILEFLKHEVSATDVNKQVFLMQNVVAIEQSFFNKFRTSKNSDMMNTSILKTILQRLEKKYRLSFQINKKLIELSENGYFSVVSISENEKNDVLVFWNLLIKKT